MNDHLGDTFGPAVIDDLLVQRNLLRAERDAALAEVERMRAMVAAVRGQVAREIASAAELYDRSSEWRDGMDEAAEIAVCSTEA